MAKKKTPARNKAGQFVKGKKKAAPKKKAAAKKGAGTRTRTTKSGTTVIVRANPPKQAPVKKAYKKKKNPPTAPWLAATGAAAAVAAGVALIKAYVPIEALKRPMVSALIGPAVALIASAMLYKKAKTRPVSYGLMGAGVYSLASYASAYTIAKVQAKAETAPQGNPPRLRYRRGREVAGVPADQRVRLARGVTSMPVASMERPQGAYQM